ncbi:MAG: DUF1153 domain-containing protein [Pseudomonadota bacterium]
MYIRKSDRPTFVLDHRGERICAADLPPPSTRRWVARRKAIVVTAVTGGLITEEEAIMMYGLSEEELESWISHFTQHGPNALRATAIQRYREVQ